MKATSNSFVFSLLICLFVVVVFFFFFFFLPRPLCIIRFSTTKVSV